METFKVELNVFEILMVPWTPGVQKIECDRVNENGHNRLLCFWMPYPSEGCQWHGLWAFKFPCHSFLIFYD